MSQSSARSRDPKRSLNSLQNGSRPSSLTRRRRPSINGNDAYLYALRVAYLAHLLQPRGKRAISKAVTKPSITRSQTSTSIHDLMKDFNPIRDSKSTKYPHDFIKELEKRLQGILVGKERRPEYQNADVKRSFAVFLNQLSDPQFKRLREQERRAEDLVLIFYSKAITEMQRGKPANDDGVKRMVDRHVALFVRLLGLILKEKDWAKDRPELASRLNTLESKLMKHEEDLSAPAVTETVTIEEEIPLSYDVKDMQLVLVVGRIFGLRQSFLQSDIDKHKPVWTEKAALQDLKTYQTHLNLGTNQALNSKDFDTREAYELWKKAEAPNLTQMMLTIVKSRPELAKSTPGGSVPEVNGQQNGVHDDAYSDLSRGLAQEENSSSYVLDLPANLELLNLDNTPEPENGAESIYTFIPNDSKGMFRYIAKQALTSDLTDESIDQSGTGSSGLLSRDSMDLMTEIAVRWRIPSFSRMVLLLDVVKEKFMDNELNLETLDTAFNYVKQPTVEDSKNQKRVSFIMTSVLQDRYKWTVTDFSMMQQVLSGIYETLLRNLYQAMMSCFDPKPSTDLGPILTVLDDHIMNDPSFAQPMEMFEQFKQRVTEDLAIKARELYDAAVEKELPAEQENWEFIHITALKKAILRHYERVQKRYRKNPEILGVEPATTLTQAMLPAFAEDSEAIVKYIMSQAASKGQEVPILDGFELYKELCSFRQVYAEALPGVPFPYKIEELLQDFVWKWIKATEQQVVGWVENAVKNDNFAVRTTNPNIPPTQEQRHSVSVIDVFGSFNQIIQQFTDLEWDDDLIYAKFMTSLARSIGNGVTRYCDLLEQMFAREMDRLTPEQEAAAKATRQERWMQLAKDTWNQRDRVEPFNFYPESFVKLNDISYAISQWDKLEQDVNVDACAEVIKQKLPPPEQRQKKFSKFVFTIKIVEAEDLKPCDVNGYSDPYVVLTDEYQKRLFKSKIVYRSLNPRFDESVDITTEGALNVIATVWDWDAVGDHDYVGRTSLKLDPSHFGDFLPREYWLDLDTQGRVLVRVSMEGERDDIQFYFAKAFRALQRTQRDMTRKITDKLSAYIHHCLSRRSLRSLLSKGMPSISNISMSTFSSWRNRQSVIPPAATAPTHADIMNALTPLFTYFDDNFDIMNRTLTSDAMIAVMTRLWKEVLVTVEGLLVPPLSDKTSQQKPLTQQELDVVYKWLQSLFDFFHAVDEETGEAHGVPLNVLKSPKYHEIQTINFFYTEPTEHLIRESERMVSASAANLQTQRSRLSAPASYGQQSQFGGGGLLAVGSAVPTRRTKSIMHSRNLGTMRKAKEEKWKAAQAEPSDDMILRILRMRPEAGPYLRDRSRQKERLAAAAAAEMIVRQSLAAGGGRMTGPSVIRR